jgi:hypothetical protein
MAVVVRVIRVAAVEAEIHAAAVVAAAPEVVVAHRMEEAVRTGTRRGYAVGTNTTEIKLETARSLSGFLLPKIAYFHGLPSQLLHGAGVTDVWVVGTFLIGHRENAGWSNLSHSGDTFSIESQARRSTGIKIPKWL